jgi:signal transduction histidine kinase
MRQGQRLNTLVNQLLDVSRLQQGQFVVNRRPLDVAVLVGQVVDEVRATLPPHSPHTIELTGPDNSVVVDGDRERLEQVLHNLLSNAIKYSPAGGLVTVEGIGIPADAQARLFDPFYRAPNVGSQASGFGLGLHIVCEIVERHGGRMEVDSTEGMGSTFRVVLPVQEPDTARGTS